MSLSKVFAASLALAFAAGLSACALKWAVKPGVSRWMKSPKVIGAPMKRPITPNIVCLNN